MRGSDWQRTEARRLGRPGLGVMALVGLALYAACANVRPLEGGPADVTPPRLLAVMPPDSSLALGPMPSLRFDFDEPLHAPSVRSGLRTYPNSPSPEVSVRGRHVELRYHDSLPPDTTLTIILGKSIQDGPGRDNKLAGEITLVFATGPALQGGAVLGRVSVKGKPEPAAVVRYEPIVPADTTALAASTPRAARRGQRPRLPVAACDSEGLFQLLALPAARPFVLTAFVDRNGNFDADEGELATAYPETLRLATSEVRRGIEWNLIDPREPGQVQGVAFNRSGIAAPLAVALQAQASAADSAAPAGAPLDSLPGGARLSAREGQGTGLDSLLSATAGADSLGPTGRADSLLSRLPQAPQGAWEKAYAAFATQAPLRPGWRVVYVSPRGDYSVRVPPGRYRLVAFVDVRGDSLPGTYVGPDSTRLEWEPLWVGGILEVAPGGEVRPRSIDIEAPP